MNTSEVATVLGLIAARYPTAKVFDQDQSVTVRVWHMTLDDVPFAAVEPVLARWFKTEKWAPDPSELRRLIAEHVAPLPGEGEVYGKRFAYFRHGRGEAMREDDAFAFRVFAEIGSPADCGQMKPEDLREAVTWAYKRLAEKERTERTANVAVSLEPQVEEPRLRALGS